MNAVIIGLVMKNGYGIFIVWILGGVFTILSFFASANNVRITGTVQVTQGTGDTLVLSFPLRWDNSWRDQFNWDAAWVFLKYKSVTGGWNHVNLCAGGHRFVNGSGLPVSFDAMPGKTGSNTVGLFIYRNTLEVGNTPEIVCQMKCLKSSLGNLTSEQFVNHEGFVLAQALEMVYVPYGVYALGDGRSGNRFAGGSDGSAVWMDTEVALNGSSQVKVYPVTNGAVGSVLTIAANYPKGYKGFYVMKYEVSQEQYVSFLNTLSYAQQQERIPGLSSLKGGEFVFGVKTAPSNRNGIIVNVVSDGSSPVIFANNLNNNVEYSEDGDGKTIACNYLSPSDMFAYCSWSGLRPMGELEYEKASRPLYPEESARGGYAWNTTVLNSGLSGVNNSGTRKELAQGGGNVNSGGGSWRQGPVRCGIFATGSSTQEGAGASFWGVMELSGNLREMCYNVNGNGAFDGSVIGDGTYNAGKWSATPSYIGVRGGSFSGADSFLRTSDRTEAGYFSALTVNAHDSTVGFRGVRPIGSDVTVTQGNLIASAGGVAVTGGKICPGTTVDITTDSPAKVTSGGTAVPNMDFTYIWYDGNGNVIPGETGETLHFSNFAVSGNPASVNYQFKRKAICPMGDATTTLLALTMPNMTLTLSANEVFLDICNISDRTVTATVPGGNSFEWYYKNGLLPVSGNNYVADRGHFGNDSKAGGDFKITCRYVNSGCQAEQDVIVHVAPDNLICPANAQDKDGNVYPVVRIGCQCWMGKNLNVGTYQATNSDYWKFDEEGIQKWCYNNVEANCTTYGGLYEWWEAVCGGKCNASVTTGNAQSLDLNSEADLVAYGARMVSGSTTQVQGICPDGWRMASDADWQTLEMQLGMSNSQAGATGWRGTDQGTQMKMPGIFNGNNWCSGAICNKSGLGLLPGGRRKDNGDTFRDLDTSGYWWSSTPFRYYAWLRILSYNQSSVCRYADTYGRSHAFSVRCVRD